MMATLAEATKVCTKCDLDLPLSRYNRSTHGRLGREAECRACKLKRRRRAEAIAADPNGIEATNVAVMNAPDPRPAILLREELQRQRAARRPWSSAWPVAIRNAVEDLPPAEAASWRRAFNDTRAAWQGSYSGIAWPVASRPLFLPEESLAA
jgi:hypothetical protein